MFKVLGQLSNTVCRTINMLDHVVEAGEFQTEILRDTSKFDAKQKRFKLDADFREFELDLKPKKLVA
jgi:hypothetical protein